jgi:hypothetical protein
MSDELLTDEELAALADEGDEDTCDRGILADVGADSGVRCRHASLSLARDEPDSRTRAR